MDKEEYYKSNAEFYEAAWKRSAAERNRDETRLNMKARWLAEQLAKVEQALNPFGFTRRDPPRSADDWLYMADSAVEYIELVSKYGTTPSEKENLK